MRTSIKEKVLKTAFIDTLPILAAFLILGMGFGVLMSDAGYSPFFVFLMSAFIYAGSMQFVAVSLIAAGTAVTQKSTRCSREHRVTSGANFPVCYLKLSLSLVTALFYPPKSPVSGQPSGCPS
jgi:hypothetical protein